MELISVRSHLNSKGFPKIQHKHRCDKNNFKKNYEKLYNFGFYTIKYVVNSQRRLF